MDLLRLGWARRALTILLLLLLGHLDPLLLGLVHLDLLLPALLAAERRVPSVHEDVAAAAEGLLAEVAGVEEVVGPVVVVVGEEGGGEAARGAGAAKGGAHHASSAVRRVGRVFWEAVGGGSGGGEAGLLEIGGREGVEGRRRREGAVADGGVVVGVNFHRFTS